MRKHNAKSSSRDAQKEKVTFLAEHNLYVCNAELRRIKQAIKDGRLWEHVEMRAHAHPALFTALKKIGNYEISLKSTVQQSRKAEFSSPIQLD
jgi:7-cyano-7-deazaguanine tRNA-ribosyltransferase